MNQQEILLDSGCIEFLQQESIDVVHH